MINKSGLTGCYKKELLKYSVSTGQPVSEENYYFNYLFHYEKRDRIYLGMSTLSVIVYKWHKASGWRLHVASAIFNFSWLRCWGGSPDVK